MAARPRVFRPVCSCNNKPMREVTERDERALGVHAWLCDRCKHEQQTLDDFGDAKPLLMQGVPRITRGGLGINRHPWLFGIIRRARRYEARIASGRAGVWVYVGLFRTIGEAIAARDAAIRQRRAG